MMKVKGLFDDIKKAYLGDKQLSQMNAFIGDTAVISGGAYPVIADNSYLTFMPYDISSTTAKNATISFNSFYGTLSISTTGSYIQGENPEVRDDIQLQYRKADRYLDSFSEWIDYNLGDVITADNPPKGSTKYAACIQFRGLNPKGVSYLENKVMHFIKANFSSDGKWTISGNICSIINGNDHVPVSDGWIHKQVGCFYKLFEQAPIYRIDDQFQMPFDYLNDFAYAYMFRNCANMNHVPSRLLTSLDNPFGYMGVHMAENCYYHMLSAMSIVEGPEIPAPLNESLTWTDTIPVGAFKNTFASNTLMTSIAGWNTVDNQALNCSERSFLNTFGECKALTHVGDYEYFVMPQFSFTGINCFMQMFSECNAIEEIKLIQDDGSHSLDWNFAFLAYEGRYQFQDMFYRCWKLKHGIHFSWNENAGISGDRTNHAFQGIYSQCNNLEDAYFRCNSDLGSETSYVYEIVSQVQSRPVNGTLYLNFEKPNFWTIPDSWTVQIID